MTHSELVINELNQNEFGNHYVDCRIHYCIINSCVSYTNCIFSNCRFLKGKQYSLMNCDFINCTFENERITRFICINGLNYNINIFNNYLCIGCQTHSFEEWKNFTDEEVSNMSFYALEFWRKNKNWILELIKNWS